MRAVINWAVQKDLIFLQHLPVNWMAFLARSEVDLSLGISNREVLVNLSRHLSALANSGGGYILLGVNPSDRLLDDGGIDVNMVTEGTRNWLDKILPVLNDPPLTNLVIYEKVYTTLSEISIPGRAVYIIEVPESQNAPHQANDHCYYTRIGEQTAALLHQPLMDIVNRQRMALINLKIDYEVNDTKLILVVHLKNTGEVTAQVTKGWVKIPRYLVPDEEISDGEIVIANSIEYFQLYFGNTISEITGGNERDFPFTTKRFEPIYPGQEYCCRIKLNLEVLKFLEPARRGFKVLWSMTVNQQPAMYGEISFREIANNSEDLHI